MAQDIMADSQTESVLSLLDRGEADDKTRDRVSAALLRSQSRLVDVVEEMQKKLWSFGQLDAHIDSRLDAHCSNCTAKKFAESQMNPAVREQQKEQSWLGYVFNEKTQMFILLLILVWTVVTMKTSADEAAAVMDRVKATISGGIAK